MANSTWASSRKTSAMAKANSSGAMGVSTKVVGTVESKVELDTTLTSTELGKREPGLTENVNAG